MVNKLTLWIGLISSTVTILLTIYNAQLNRTIQETELQLRQVETDLKRRAQDLEVQKERTSRYEFVNKLLPDLLKKDRTQVILTTNLIMLALSEQEATKLFDGFQASSDKGIQEVGKLGSDYLAAQRERLRSALSHEAAGFDALIRGDIKAALDEFEATERVYPTFHQAFEISRLLRQNENAMDDPDTRKKVFRQIVTQLNYGVPSQYISRLDELSR